MQRKLNKQQEEEVLFIRNWCLTVIDFIYSKSGVNPSLTESYKEAFSEETQKRYLEKVSPSVFLKGLKQAYRDANEMAKDAPQTILDDLNKILRDKFGKDLNNYSQNTSEYIAKMIVSGKIINDEEYRIVDERVNELCQTNPKSPEIAVLNDLLLKFDSKKNIK